jgi:hypothetical protein
VSAGAADGAPLVRPAVSEVPLAVQLRSLIGFWWAAIAARWRPWRRDPFGAALDLLCAQPESLAEHHYYTATCGWIPGDFPGLLLLRVGGVLYHLLIATPVMVAAGIASTLAARPSWLAGVILFAVSTRAIVAVMGHL